MEAADIAVQSSNYTGNANLGGGDLGVAKIDTSPVQNLAHYTYLYNKSMYDQRQKDADDMIKQLASLTDFDPNAAIPRDKQAALDAAKQLLDKGNEFARSVYKNPQDKINKQWEFQKGISDTLKTVDSIKARAIAYNKRLQDINNNTAMSEDQKRIKRAQLEQDANSDVNTPIATEDKFDETIPDIATGTLRKIAVASILPNDNRVVKAEIVTPMDLLRQSQAESTGVQSIFNGEHSDYFKAGKNPFTIFHNSAEAYNAALYDKKYQRVDETGNVVLKNGKPDVDFDAIKQSNPLLHDMSTLIDQFNDWSTRMKNQAVSGVFTDNLGKQVKSMEQVSPSEFFTIDKTKPLTGDQIIMLEKFRKTPQLFSVTDDDLKHTGEANDLIKAREQMANARLLKSMDESGANYRAGLDLIGKGYTRNAKTGKWEKPANAITTETNGGIVPYWENNILPQIKAGIGDLKVVTEKGGWFSSDKKAPIPSDYSGDVDVPTNKLSGLSVALTGEKDDKGKDKGIGAKSKVQVRLQAGVPVGVVIDGTFYDQNDINSKATRLQDKTITNKQDTPIFQTTVPAGGGTPVMSEAAYQDFLKKNGLK